MRSATSCLGKPSGKNVWAITGHDVMFTHGHEPSALVSTNAPPVIIIVPDILEFTPEHADPGVPENLSDDSDLHYLYRIRKEGAGDEGEPAFQGAPPGVPRHARSFAHRPGQRPGFRQSSWRASRQRSLLQLQSHQLSSHAKHHPPPSQTYDFKSSAPNFPRLDAVA